MRLIDADKLYPDRMTKEGLAISQTQIANAPTVSIKEWVTEIPDYIKRAMLEALTSDLKGGTT